MGKMTHCEKHTQVTITLRCPFTLTFPWNNNQPHLRAHIKTQQMERINRKKTEKLLQRDNRKTETERQRWQCENTRIVHGR